VDVEASPATVRTLPIARGVFAHANHFLDPAALQISQPLDQQSSTYARCERLQALLEQQQGMLTAAAAMRLLRDHAGHPLSICAHPAPAWPPEERLGTMFSTVMDLHAGVMYAAAGNPCVVSYTRYTV
jgi:isopenicillin-N N-acyltransferase-like protein